MNNFSGLTKFSFLYLFIAAVVTNGQIMPTSKSQLTYGNVKSEYDSVVVSDLAEPELPYYTAIRIYRNGKSIYTHKDSTIELCSTDGTLFKEYLIPGSSDSYLLFTASGRPGSDYFLVLKKANGTYAKFGTTPISTADIFGDIDYDGFFEIGGFRSYDYGGVSIDEEMKMIAQEYRIFEIKNGFPLDSTLMKTLLPTVLKNFRERLKR